VLLLAGLLGVGLLGLLALNTVLTQGSFATADLTAKQDALSEQEQALQQQVALLQSPQQLAAAATRLGMVGTHNPVFIDTKTGKILGVPQAAAWPAPTASASPSASGTPSPGATTTPSGQPTAGATTKPTTKPTTEPTTKPTAHTSPSPHPTGAAR
jgi:hypothetical protein